MNVSDWLTMASVLVALFAAGWAVWANHRASEATKTANSAQVEAAEALKKAAEALDRAHPPRKPIAFTLEALPGSTELGDFRLRNAGESRASNVVITVSEDFGFPVKPDWATDGPHTFDRGDWEDVILRLTLPNGSIGTPREVLISCDEHTDPIRVEVPYVDIRGSRPFAKP